MPNGKEVEAVCKEEKSVSPYDGSNIQFTSGTTGRPKATLLNHRALVNNSRQVKWSTDILKKEMKNDTNVEGLK